MNAYTTLKHDPLSLSVLGTLTSLNYIMDHTYLEVVTPQQRRRLRIIVAKYVIIEQVLYRKAFDGMLL
ncbi:hypothetical protein KI387_008915, partial [Taxus chinensis]